MRRAVRELIPAARAAAAMLTFSLCTRRSNLSRELSEVGWLTRLLLSWVSRSPRTRQGSHLFGAVEVSLASQSDVWRGRKDGFAHDAHLRKVRSQESRGARRSRRCHPLSRALRRLPSAHVSFSPFGRRSVGGFVVVHRVHEHRLSGWSRRQNAQRCSPSRSATHVQVKGAKSGSVLVFERMR
jgi:hypothetical protein